MTIAEQIAHDFLDSVEKNIVPKVIPIEVMKKYVEEKG